MTFDKAPELLGIAITVAAVFSTFSVDAISANASTPAAPHYRPDCAAGVVPSTNGRWTSITSPAFCGSKRPS